MTDGCERVTDVVSVTDVCECVTDVCECDMSAGVVATNQLNPFWHIMSRLEDLLLLARCISPMLLVAHNYPHCDARHICMQEQVTEIDIQYPHLRSLHILIHTHH